MNGVNNDWLQVEAEAHQSWPPKKKLTNYQIEKDRERKRKKKQKYR